MTLGLSYIIILGKVSDYLVRSATDKTLAKLEIDRDIL